MSEPLRIAVLGLTHDHVWGNLDELGRTEGAELAGAADPHPPLREELQRRFAAPVYGHYEQLLDEQRPQAVYLYSDNAQSAELAQLAAGRGLHVLVEKPLAHSLAAAEEMLVAVRRAGVRMMVNWPFAWWPAMQHALSLAAEGEVGEIWQVKYRAAHAGPEELGCSSYFCDWLFDRKKNGGGALIDYCCYGALLACRLLGTPSRVYATAGRLQKEHITVEDNAVIVMTYPRASAISEGSWLQAGNLSSYVTMIYGVRGTLLVEPRANGRLLLADEQHPQGREIEVPPSPPRMQTASAHFVHALATGEPFAPLVEDRLARDAQEVLEAGQRSARRGKEVSLPL